MDPLTTVLIGTIVAAFVVTPLLPIGRRGQPDPRWGEVAAEHELGCVPKALEAGWVRYDLSGRVGGRRVKGRVIDHPRHDAAMRVAVARPGNLRPGVGVVASPGDVVAWLGAVRIEFRVDPNDAVPAAIVGDGVNPRMMVAELEFMDAVGHRDRLEFELGITGGQAELAARGITPENLMETLSRFVELVDRLIAASTKEWREAADALELDDHGFDPRGRLILGGEVEGRTVRVEAGHDQSHIRAAWLHPQGPDTLLIVHRAHADAGPSVEGAMIVKTGNPVLEMTVLVASTDPESTARLLTRPGLAEAVLEIVHAHPGSTVTAGQVTCVVQERSLDLQARVAATRAVARLAGLLSD